MKVLVLCDYYLPGFKAGGALRTIVNMVNQLGDLFDFWILTGDRDMGDEAPYEVFVRGGWNVIGNAKVRYLSPDSNKYLSIISTVRELRPDVLYVNSIFSPLTRKVLLLRCLAIFSRIPFILAPEGEFSPGALMIKGLKKKAYLYLSMHMKMYRNVIWKASCEEEANDIKKILGQKIKIKIAPNIPDLDVRDKRDLATQGRKEINKVRLVYLSRITPKKNLCFALEVVSRVGKGVTLDIYGPVDDFKYWRKCQALMKKGKEHEAVISYYGPIDYQKVRSTIEPYDFLLFPTGGENFGHIIYEALSAGCPVIASNKTPWTAALNAGFGWALPLDDLHRWTDVIKQCLEMDYLQHLELRKKARDYAESWATRSEIVKQNRALLMEVDRNPF